MTTEEAADEFQQALDYIQRLRDRDAQQRTSGEQA